MDNLKEHIKETKNLTEKLEEAAENLAIVKEEVFDMKIDILGAAFGMLMTKFNESIDDWTKMIAEKGEQDKGVGDQIKEVVERAISAFAQKKEINIESKPQIKIDVDFGPVLPILKEMSTTNAALSPLLNKLLTADGGKSEKLHDLIVSMVNKQNDLIEKGLKEIDYSDKLDKMIDRLNRDDRVQNLVVKRDELKLITNVIPIYKDTKK